MSFTHLGNAHQEKSPSIKQVNEPLLTTINPERVEVEILLMSESESTSAPGIEDAELDEMWSFVGKKANQRWLWHAIDRLTGKLCGHLTF